MVYREDDGIRSARAKTREAIALAMESRWEEAAAVNRELIELAPDDLDACNRLGKALLELGDAKGARGAFERSLAIDPSNGIARKNVDRLTTSGPQTARPGGSPLATRLFIGDTGKSAQVTLLACAADSDRPFISPGAPVELRCQRGTLAVYNQAGQYIGVVPPKLGRRLVCMMEEGNLYEGAVASSTADAVRIVLRESYQHPSQRAKLSFPPSSLEAASAAQARRRDTTPTMDREVVLAWGDEDRDDHAMRAAGATVGAMLEGFMPDDSLLPELPED